MAAPYRDDDDALTTRLGTLLEQLDTVRARTLELKALDLREKDIEEEIEAVRQRLERRAARRRLPLLDQVKVASPCPADWDSMTGDERSRFCAQCGKDVHNISGMPREDAEVFLRGVVGDVCIRLYRRDDGTVLTADCAVGVRRKRRRRAVASLLGGSLVTAGALLSQARMGGASFGAVQGRMAAPPSSSAAPEVPAPTATPRDDGDWMAGVIAPPSPPTRAALQKERLNALLASRAKAKDPAARRGLEAQVRELQKELQARPAVKCTCAPGDPLCDCE
jgi:hypothetical protein